MASCRKCHTLQPEDSSPKRDSNSRSSIGGSLGKQTCQPLHHASPNFLPRYHPDGSVVGCPSREVRASNLVFHGQVTPTLTYQCQTWSLTKDLERKLVTCEMKCLRKAVNKTRRDKIRTEVIRDMAGAKPVLQHIKQQQVKWF